MNISAGSLHPQAPGAPESWGLRHAHDPTVVRDEDGTYYMFSTDAVANAAEFPAGVHIRRSPDLVAWDFVGTALPGVPGPAARWSGAAGLWAPDVVRWPDGAWHMYYSASTFGSRTSAIGLATAASPAGPWADRGLVITTRQGESGHNAIDAAVTFDRSGAPWLTYGSFFDGIYTLRLDPETGFALAESGRGTLLARRPDSVDGAVEGAFVLYRPEEDRYVLFVSYDSLAGTYNIRTAVAAQITGPYLDRNGRALTETEQDPQHTGTKILGSYGFPGDTAWLGPGHNSVLPGPAPAGGYFLVHHVRYARDPAQHTGQLRRLYFTASGWPVAAPHPFAGLATERLTAPEPVSGNWQVIRLDPSSTDLATASTLVVSSPELAFTDGTPAAVRVRAGTEELDAVVFAGWDRAAGRSTLCFSGLDSRGTAWWGSKEGVS